MWIIILTIITTTMETGTKAMMIDRPSMFGRMEIPSGL